MNWGISDKDLEMFATTRKRYNFKLPRHHGRQFAVKKLEEFKKKRGDICGRKSNINGSL